MPIATYGPAGVLVENHLVPECVWANTPDMHIVPTLQVRTLPRSLGATIQEAFSGRRSPESA